MSVASVAAAVALILLGAPATPAAPSPSPSLDGLLSTPASSYVRDSSLFAAIQGSFDAVDYLGVLNPRKPSETLATLREDGFVQGYGRSWFDRAAGRLLSELVVAFSGGAGAKRWLPEAMALSQDNVFFTSDVPVSGIEAAFGSHFENPKGPAYVDEIGFVKGNDYFFVYVFSFKNDLADAAVKQARQQYDFAPAQTISPSQWPENATNHSNRSTFSTPSMPPAGIAIIAIAATLVLLAAVLLAVLLISRGRRGRAEQGADIAAGGLQMSADGTYWWDGQAWRNASEAAPPAAQRAPDGRYWWDGSKWRQMPSGPEPAPPSSPSLH
ncbi:MAG TPA: hypothetical protein VJR46_05490 [Candidatus Dormibacteraeota bacterium]|nr:hypothetical protein [Candidatus Dormibacteraeota bacterium]